MEPVLRNLSVATYSPIRFLEKAHVSQYMYVKAPRVDAVGN
jgi:hypothetical protein